MNGELDWDETTDRLVDLLGRLPGGSVLRLREVAQPVDGWIVEIRQHPDRLTAVVHSRATDRRSGVNDTLRGLGWNPPDPAHRGNWWTELEWPPLSAGYRGLATGVVDALRYGAGLDRPTACAYEFLSVGGGRLPTALGLETCEVDHYVRLAPGDTPNRPSGVLRRTRIRHRYHDEALNRDGEWRPTETIVLSELGRVDDRVVPVGLLAAERVVNWWHSMVREEQRLRAERQAAEDRRAGRDPSLPRVAMAVDRELDETGRPVVRTPRLHERERAAVAAYLRGAPLVAVAYGFDPDPFDPLRPQVVPLNVRTDGDWVWSESLAYYADRYGIGPEPDLMAHLARRQYQLPDVDDERVARAAEALRG